MQTDLSHSCLEDSKPAVMKLCTDVLGLFLFINFSIPECIPCAVVLSVLLKQPARRGFLRPAHQFNSDCICFVEVNCACLNLSVFVIFSSHVSLIIFCLDLIASLVFSLSCWLSCCSHFFLSIWCVMMYWMYFVLSLFLPVSRWLLMCHMQRL